MYWGPTWGVIQGRHKFELKLWKPILKPAFQTQSSLFLRLLIYSSFLWYSLATSLTLAFVPNSWDTQTNKPSKALVFTGFLCYWEARQQVKRLYQCRSDKRGLHFGAHGKGSTRWGSLCFSLLSICGMFCLPGTYNGWQLSSDCFKHLFSIKSKRVILKPYSFTLALLWDLFLQVWFIFHRQPATCQCTAFMAPHCQQLSKMVTARLDVTQCETRVEQRSRLFLLPALLVYSQV